MKSLFNLNQKQELIFRINSLTSDTIPNWGIMNASQMLAHCTVSVKLAFNEIIPEKNETFLEIGKRVRDRLFETDMFSKNLQTTSEFLNLPGDKFEENKKMLLEYIDKFSDAENVGIETGSHPYFGKLNINEWDSLIYKHTNHHLIQFGV